VIFLVSDRRSAREIRSNSSSVYIDVRISSSWACSSAWSMAMMSLHNRISQSDLHSVNVDLATVAKSSSNPELFQNEMLLKLLIFNIVCKKCLVFKECLQRIKSVFHHKVHLLQPIPKRPPYINPPSPSRRHSRIDTQ
jgi:hypothetical protein